MSAGSKFTKNDVMLFVYIEHPFYGKTQIRVTKRLRSSLENDLKSKTLNWYTHQIPIVSHTDITPIDAKENPELNMIQIVVPWDHGT